MKQLNRVKSIANTVLITSTVSTGSIYIIILASVVRPSVDILLSGGSVLFSIATVITQ